jgi:glycosyltransferase involved in cell wall biosynthesis
MKRRVFVLYESDAETGRPYCSGHLRLLRPLAHPSTADAIELHSGRYFRPGTYDAVIVQRHSFPGATVADVDEFIDAVRQCGARLIFELDDNLFDLPGLRPVLAPGGEKRVRLLEHVARQSSAIIVSTEPLRERVQRYNDRVIVLPNALDERLVARRSPDSPEPGFRGHALRIGYMGTRTHDADLQIVLPALRAIHARYGDRVEIEILGVLSEENGPAGLRGLPIRFVGGRYEQDYPLFMLEFTGSTRWDIALSPFVEDAFTVCKSDLKVLDYAACGAAALFSRAGPYREIEAKGLGLVVENTTESWVAGLQRLVEDAALRARLARSNWEYLHQERTLLASGQRWIGALEQALA